MVNRLKNLALLLLIVLLAAFFRLIGLNWDQGHYLHPDERFLSMTIAELKLPKNIAEYFDQQSSTLNPRNINRDFFVYGNLPISISKLTNEIFKKESLEEIIITGRYLSAINDLLIILLIYLTVLLFENNFKQKKLRPHPQTKFWASLVYALAVLPIQQSHFFTTDTFLNLFVFLSFYFSLKYFFKNKLIYLILAGVSLGLAIASKITAIFILPLNLSLLLLNNCWPIPHQLGKNKILHNVKQILCKTIIFIIFGYLTLRVTSPYIFASSSFFEINLSQEFISDLEELKSFSDNEVWYPPAIQWMNRSQFFGLINLIIFGLGVVSSFFVLIGLKILFKKIDSLLSNLKLQKPLLVLVLINFWLICFLIYYSAQFVQSMRYYLIIYPFLAMLAGLAINNIIQNKKNKLLSSILIILILGIWPLMFISIYLKPHSRIQASEWIYQNIPEKSIILAEYWDDALPLNLAVYQNNYEIVQLPVFAPDDEYKWQEIETSLSRADYYILSSNRAWGSIKRLSDKYPQMSKFYQELLANKTDYRLLAKFTSYPSLTYLGLNISFNDSWAEEAFSVYDHPEVLIFQKK